ncbi:caspase family protein [Acidisphaera sp. S103]|uniref:caspase family protein n=1 Tax=Acidisphaera sp. S103 TaxID=1747223 RepID=UPI00131D7838|nr:caspase family protein [Acidisphaera sp. S103]
MTRLRHLGAFLALGLLIALASCVSGGGGAGGSIAVLDSVEAPKVAALRIAPRIALVIGNGAYGGPLIPLKTAKSDAQHVAAVLRQSGFQIVGGGAQLDVNRERFDQLLDQTDRAVQQNPGAVVVVYFSGHGYVRGGHSYLAPVNWDPGKVDPERANAAAEGGLIGIAQNLASSGAGLTIMFVDACRDAVDGQAGGLLEEKVPDNTFIGFAAQFGAVALEPAAGADGYYTAALLTIWNRRWDRIEDMHTALASEVLQGTQARQIPVYREGASMPVVPVRFGSADPQSLFARAAYARTTAQNADVLAARCDAMSDMRIIAGSVPVHSSGKLPIVPGPRGQAVDLENARRACNDALDAGVRTASVLRGAAITDILIGVSQDRGARDRALLAQAAELGDPSAEFLLANLASISDPSAVDKQTLVYDRLVRVENANVPMLSAWLALIRLNLGEQNRQLQEFTNLTMQPVRAMEVLRREAELGDQTALVELFFLYVERPEFRSQIDGPWLRGQIRRAVARGDESVGMELGGLTPYQSLYLMLIFDYGANVLSPLNANEFLDVLLPTEPFFGQLNAAFHQAFPSLNLVGILACRVVMGIDVNRQPVPGGVANPEAGLRFLESVAAYGGPNGQAAVGFLRRGHSLNCL